MSITCPSCKYTVGEHQPFYYEKVIRFKSGKRKGQIKNVVDVCYDPEENKSEFHDVVMRKDVDEIGVIVHDCFTEEFRELDLKCCPQCGTVFANNIEWIG